MVKYVRSKLEDAEKTKKSIVDVFDSSFPVKKEGGFVFFPVKEKVKGFDVVDLDVEPRPKRPRSIKEALSDCLSEEELEHFVSSFDVIGDIAIIDVPEELYAKKKMIGEAVLETHKNIHAVLNKKTGRKGVYRTLSLEFMAGIDKRETIYKEHGVRLKLNVEQVYFSPRLSEERRRISSLVKEGELVAGLFAGVGPFPLVIARQNKCKVYSVELNPVAVKYMKENIELNKNILKGEVVPIQGDVLEVVNRLPECDRVLMPLPKGGEDFLDAAFRVCKDHGVIHFYQFAPDEDLYSEALGRISSAAAKAGKQFRVLNKHVVRPFSPRISQVVLDFEIGKSF